MRIDPLDAIDPLARQGRETEADRDDHLAPDDEVVLEEEVVVLADGAVDDVLDRHDADRRSTRGDGLEDGPEAQRRSRDVAQGGKDGVPPRKAPGSRAGDGRRSGMVAEV